MKIKYKTVTASFYITDLFYYVQLTLYFLCTIYFTKKCSRYFVLSTYSIPSYIKL